MSSSTKAPGVHPDCALLYLAFSRIKWNFAKARLISECRGLFFRWSAWIYQIWASLSVFLSERGFLNLDVGQWLVYISEAFLWPQSSCGVSLQILKTCAFKVSWPETDGGCQPIKEKRRQGHSWQPLTNRVLLGKTLNFNGFSCHRSNSWAKSAVSRWLSQRCGQAWDWWKEVEGLQRPKWAFLANLQKRCNLWLNPFSPHQGAAPPCKGDLIAPNNRNQSQHGVPAWPTFVRWHLTVGQKRYCWYYGFA